MSYEHCTDPDGAACFPIYGIAPHCHTHDAAGHALPGHTVLLPREQWPANFMEDPERPGTGVYWCPYCGDGRPADAASPRGVMAVDELKEKKHG